MVLELIIAATVLVSLVSVLGLFVLSFREKILHTTLFLLISLATGTLLGSAFLDLLPESLEKIDVKFGLVLTLSGIVVFFIIEKLIHWHHHHNHKHEKEEKPLAYLSLIGDGVHNFFDGAAIAASFMVDPQIGFTTTFAIILHEIPQEIGDFSLLIYSGFSKTKALVYNFLSGILSVAGALAFYYLSPLVEHSESLALAFTAGAFIYIAAADLVPEIHKEKEWKKSFLQLLTVLVGVTLIWIIVTYIE
ncbi:ZIP family metal transporter [Candidatus Micrarchaeota archaeon]|nr:ZIP family metal transporter [Candidatus Micrarchaeota archaeon]